ncbi:MAG: peptide deformylase [Elusimicrobiota bacterium]|nr:peptide deformylase [Elusimicrobiota bacterium]
MTPITPVTIRLYGDPILRRKSREVKEIDGNIRKLIDNMAKLMYQNKGLGLAAPQVGILKRVIVADVGDGLVSLVNPRILWRQGKDTMSEGCLSIPVINLEIKRSKEVIVEGLTKEGEKVQLGAVGLLARVLQHEIDHLDGILIIDYVPKKRIKSIKKELDKIKTMAQK